MGDALDIVVDEGVCVGDGVELGDEAILDEEVGVSAAPLAMPVAKAVAEGLTSAVGLENWVAVGFAATTAVSRI